MAILSLDNHKQILDYQWYTINNPTHSPQQAQVIQTNSNICQSIVSHYSFQDTTVTNNMAELLQFKTAYEICMLMCLEYQWWPTVLVEVNTDYSYKMVASVSNLFLKNLYFLTL